ncbi:MAG: hypothetical protein Ta2G_21870 [Termitinemataceae bacterium]|nr:MAG: hypothetical protein Ta2G_21870 [Termitinemataceae bacterium]
MNYNNIVNISIGRENCDINIPNSKVSRHHADIKVEGAPSCAKYFFADHSTNGTAIDGRRVHNASAEIFPQNHTDIYLAGSVELDWKTIEAALGKKGFPVNSNQTFSANTAPIRAHLKTSVFRCFPLEKAHFAVAKRKIAGHLKNLIWFLEMPINQQQYQNASAPIHTNIPPIILKNKKYLIVAAIVLVVILIAKSASVNAPSSSNVRSQLANTTWECTRGGAMFPGEIIGNTTLYFSGNEFRRVGGMLTKDGTYRVSGNKVVLTDDFGQEAHGSLTGNSLSFGSAIFSRVQ